ncbi:MAG: cell wall hydrolase, partial [Alphaproteobacteria bacterium]|nr:cell wall hydrolase [Alphaproteobacteria bacterium]
MKHDELDIMARTVWGEARGEDEIGKIAVAHVIKNRAKHPKWWGKTIMEVCLKPWQFSCWNKKDPNREKMDAVTTNDPTFKLCLSVCKNV